MTDGPEATNSGKIRFNCANRRQLAWRDACWDELLTRDHPARAVWQFVEGLDLSPIIATYKATAGVPGANPIDVRILMTLWLYATLRGLGSARELARRCSPQGEIPFQWICGDVTVNHHTLSTFRTTHIEFLDRLLTESVAVLLHEGLVDMERVAQDGIRVRASAGSGSFRRRETLEKCLREADAQINALRAELENDVTSSSRRQQAAKERAATERQARIEAALKHLPEIEAKKKADEKQNARASTTDAEARVMKMANGGFNPAYNAQFATDTKTQIITGVDVTNNGGDRGEMGRMIEQHKERYGQVPDDYLVDGGFSSKDDVEQVSSDSDNDDSTGTTVYAPLRKCPKGGDPHARRDDESQAVGDWRERMGTEEAKEIYKERAATAECVNAIARNRGLQQFKVRGLRKVKAILLWFALAHNLVRSMALRGHPLMVLR
jgi:transposase